MSGLRPAPECMACVTDGLFQACCMACAASQLHAILLLVFSSPDRRLFLCLETAALAAAHLPQLKMHFLCPGSDMHAHLLSILSAAAVCLLGNGGLCGTLDVLRLPASLGPLQLSSAECRCMHALPVRLALRPPESPSCHCLPAAGAQTCGAPS